MAINNPISVKSRDPFGGLFLGSDQTYTPTEYNKYDYQSNPAYSGYSSSLGSSARNELGRMIGGNLSSNTQSILDQQFKKNLAATRENAYGMPLGSAMGLETKAAAENALSAGQLAEQQKNFALSTSLGYENLGQQDVQYGFGKSAEENARMNASRASENTNAQNWEQKQRDEIAKNSGYRGGLLQDAADIGRAGVGMFLGSQINKFINPLQDMKTPYLGKQWGSAELSSPVDFNNPPKEYDYTPDYMKRWRDAYFTNNTANKPAPQRLGGS